MSSRRCTLPAQDSESGRFFIQGEVCSRVLLLPSQSNPDGRRCVGVAIRPVDVAHVGRAARYLWRRRGISDQPRRAQRLHPAQQQPAAISCLGWRQAPPPAGRLRRSCGGRRAARGWAARGWAARGWREADPEAAAHQSQTPPHVATPVRPLAAVGHQPARFNHDRSARGRHDRVALAPIGVEDAVCTNAGRRPPLRNLPESDGLPAPGDQRRLGGLTM